MGFPCTFADIQDAVLNKGKLDDTYDANRIKDWINQAYFQAVVETNFYDNTATSVVLAQNAQNVNVPTAIIAIEFVVPTGSDGSVWGPMEMVTMEEILSLRAYNSGVALTTGAPARYNFNSGQQPVIEFWPSASGGEILTFYGQSFPPSLSAPTDIPMLPEPYASKVLEYGALVQAAEFKRDIFVLDFFQQQYQDWRSRLLGFMNTRVGDKTQQFTVEGAVPYPRNNSSDTPYNW